MDIQVSDSLITRYEDEIAALKVALREMRDKARELEIALYDVQMAARKEELDRLPKPNLRDVSEQTRNDYYNANNSRGAV